MPKITCQLQGKPTYVDLPANNTLYVPRGTQVNFKLAGPGLPAAPPPMNVPVTFNTASTSAADFKNTVVSCGGVSLTARTIVFDLELRVTPKDNFAGRSLTDFGVDERVDLDLRITPAGVTATQAGGLKWVIVGALGGKSSGNLQKTAADKSLPASDGKAHYIAPYLTSVGALIFPAGSMTPAPASLQKTVTLKVVVQDGPVKGWEVTRNFTIRTPQAAMEDNRNEHQHVQNFPSAGFRGDIYLSPKNVSFRTLEWREAGGKANCYVTVTPGTPGGYFIYSHGKPHHPTGTDPSGGNFNSEVRKIGDGDLADGCWVKQVDNVWSGYNTDYPGPYTQPPHAGVATNVASTMSWPIYWQYRVSGGADSSWNTFQKAEHKVVMAADGSCTISKAGASVAFALADATETFP